MTGMNLADCEIDGLCNSMADPYHRWIVRVLQYQRDVARLKFMIWMAVALVFVMAWLGTCVVAAVAA